MAATVLLTEKAVEAERLRAVHDLAILDTLPEAIFDQAARLAANICNTPIALISFIDEKRQWFKAQVGVDTAEMPRSHSFCENLIGQSEPLIVPDATLDPRFSENPFVKDAPGLRFYAGVPLNTSTGLTVGSLCVVDVVPHELTSSQKDALQVLGQQVSAHMEIRVKLNELSDVLQKKAIVEEELGRRNLLFTAFMEHSPTMAFIKDHEGRFVYYNRWFCERYEVSPTEWIGKSVHDLFPREFAEAYHAADLQIMRSGVPETIEETSPGPHGTMQYWRTYKFRIADGVDNVLLGAVCLDISSEQATVARLRKSHEQLERENKTLSERSTTDSLTGLSNRRAFDERFQTELAKGSPCSLALLDIDHFKGHNDTYGHQHGDEVLRTVASLLKKCCRDEDFLARIGGEEFGVLLIGADSAMAFRTADRLRRAVQDHYWQAGAVTISAGVATLSSSLKSSPELFAAADEALYLAKRRGRNRVELRRAPFQASTA